MAIDYQAANRKFRAQKSQLSRAVNQYQRGGGQEAQARVRSVVEQHVQEWDLHPFNGAWPDDWSRWQRALDDVGLYYVSVEDLAGKG